MESFYDKRKKGIKMIISTLREIDDYNLTHQDAKMVDTEKFIKEIMVEFELSRSTAYKWLKEAMEYNKPTHDYIQHQEAIARGIIKQDAVETEKEIQDIISDEKEDLNETITPKSE
jgi:hypothetical protein